MGYNWKVKIHYETYKLKNGMQVLLIKSRNSYSVDIGASTRLGAALENEQNQGISHFVEHMSLTATEKYPNKKLFNEIAEYNGASTNGGTSSEYVSYTVNLPYKKLDFGLDLMDQILYKSTFNPKYIEKERSIILDELSKYEDDVYHRNNEYIMNSLLAKKSGYSLETGGTKDTVKSFTRRQLLNHYKKMHEPQNILLTVAGNFNVDRTKELIKKYYGAAIGGNTKYSYPDDDILKKKLLVKNDKKTNLIMHSSVFPFKDGESLTTYESTMTYLIRVILTGISTSLLNKRLREEEGLLYSVSTSFSIYKKFSYIEIYFEIAPHLYHKALHVLLEELDTLYKNGITEKQLKHFKEFLINRNLIDMDSFHRNAIRIRNAVFYNKDVYAIEELNKIIRKMNAREVNSYIKTIFNLKHANHIAYGNTSEDTTGILNSEVKAAGK